MDPDSDPDPGGPKACGSGGSGSGFGSRSATLYQWVKSGLKVVSFDGSRFKLFTLRFSTNSCRPHPVSGLKLLSEPCFCHLKSLIFSKQRPTVVSEVYENIRETCKPFAQFKHRYSFLADIPNIAVNYRVIWKDLWWRADSYRSLLLLRRCTIPVPLF
jgi:hypothetical protein